MTAPREMVSADLVNRLRGIVAGKLRDRAEIDDVVQEVLIKIVRDGAAVSPDRFWGWLKQVIYTTVKDVYRASSARRPDDERELLRAVDIEGIAQRDLAAAYCPPAERDADVANSSWRDLSLATRPS